MAKRILKWVAGVLIFASMAWYIWHARRQLSVVLHLDPRYLWPMVAVPLASLLVNGWIGRELAAEFGVTLSWVEWYGLAVVNSLGNYLPLPQAGAMARGAYLKRVHGLEYRKYAATLYVTYLSAVALYGVLGLVGLGVSQGLGHAAPGALWSAFGALSILGGLGCFFRPFAPNPTGQEIGIGGALLARVMLLQLALVSLTTTGLWLACHTLPEGHGVSWPTALMLGLMVLASGIANVTPGNVGVEQGAAEITARLLRVTPNVGFLASAIFRAVSVVTVLVVGPVFVVLLMKRKNAEAAPVGETRQ